MSEIIKYTSRENLRDLKRKPKPPRKTRRVVDISQLAKDVESLKKIVIQLQKDVYSLKTKGDAA